VNPIGRIATIGFFTILLGVGFSGLVQLRKDFKVEWFFPTGSYVKDYIDLNEKYFSVGQTFSLYANGMDLYAKQNEIKDVFAYIDYQDFIREQSVTENWFAEFSGTNTYTDRTLFWNDLWAWCNAAGSKYKPTIKWTAPACNGVACTENERQQGIAHAQLGKATLKAFDTGTERFEVYRTMREDVSIMFADNEGMMVFPYSQEFLYWEEVGIIDAELVRNLVIAMAIVFAIVAMLIPQPRIFTIVAFTIVAAVLDVIGLAHYMGVTMNGVSTIYFLICTGLAVDYAAHIGHTFKDCEGSSQQRAVDAMVRIGPSVWNAVFSTLLAVIVLGFSKSFVFEVFFKVLLLVSLVAGAHGLLLLPAMLSIVGGSKNLKVAVADEPSATKLGPTDPNEANVSPPEVVAPEA
jgi:hypothetical protein